MCCFLNGTSVELICQVLPVCQDSGDSIPLELAKLPPQTDFEAERFQNTSAGVVQVFADSRSITPLELESDDAIESTLIDNTFTKLRWINLSAPRTSKFNLNLKFKLIFALARPRLRLPSRSNSFLLFNHLSLICSDVLAGGR